MLTALLIIGCAAPPAVELPPAVETPPAIDPGPPRKTISGTITTPRGSGAEGAMVRLRECNGTREWGAVADEQGHYAAEVDADVDCVTVTATAGGSSGTSSSSTSLELPRAPRLTEQRAQELIDALLRGDAQLLETYTPHHAEALRVALENMPVALGEHVVATRVRDSLIGDGFEYELRGSKGSTRVYVVADDLHRVTGPLLEYSFRGAQYVTHLARLIASGDAERLARLLNPDDVDYPVEDARKLIARMQPRLDWSRSRARFTGIDASTIRFELTDGSRTVNIPLGYGDGLLGLREDLLR